MMATPAAPQQQRGRPALSPSWADALRGWAATRDTGVLDALAVVSARGAWGSPGSAQGPPAAALAHELV